MKKIAICTLLLASIAVSTAEAKTNLINLSPSNDFNQLINDSNYKGVVVDFYAPWCGPCKALAPTITRLAEENQTILFIKVNTQSFAALSSKYSVRSIPTILFIKNGSVINRVVGLDITTIKKALTKF